MSIKTFAAALTLTAAVISPAQASTTFSLLDGVVESTPLTGVTSSGPDAITLDATGGGGGVFVSGQALSQIGINRLYVANSTSLPFTDTDTTLSGLSFWADNLSVTSASANPVHMSIDFSVSGRTAEPAA
jgi:hypothetical protein